MTKIQLPHEPRVRHRPVRGGRDLGAAGQVEGAVDRDPEGDAGLPQRVRGQAVRVRADSARRSLEKNHPKEPHYYLEFLGTDPAHQRKGLGAAVLEPVLAKCDAEGLGAYLESSKDVNVPYYRHFGFEVRQEITHKNNGPKQWLMWRDPK